jgi:hypothetical protein
VGQVLFTSTILDRDETTWAELAVVVRQAQIGDRDAVGALVEQFQPTVYASPCAGWATRATHSS